MTQKRDRSLWVGVLIAFIVIISAWTILIAISQKNKPRTINRVIVNS